MIARNNHRRLYFAPTRPVFELFELFDQENDPNEFKNLRGGKELQALERECKAALPE